jgi:hypothetical protein
MVLLHNCRLRLHLLYHLPQYHQPSYTRPPPAAFRGRQSVLIEAPVAPESLEGVPPVVQRVLDHFALSVYFLAALYHGGDVFKALGGVLVEPVDYAEASIDLE